MDFDLKIIFALIAILLTLMGYIPYMRGIIKRTNKPHIFTWIIWTIVAAIAFAAQWHEGAGPGSWVTGVICCGCFTVSILSLKQGTKNIARADIVMFVGALSAIPVWLLTNDPLWSVVIVTLINTVAFYPTFRKTWEKPHEEHISLYAMNIPRQALSIAAMTQHSLTTVLYPASIIVMCLGFVLTVLYRRNSLTK